MFNLIKMIGTPEKEQIFCSASIRKRSSFSNVDITCLTAAQESELVLLLAIPEPQCSRSFSFLLYFMFTYFLIKIFVFQVSDDGFWGWGTLIILAPYSSMFLLVFSIRLGQVFNQSENLSL